MLKSTANLPAATLAHLADRLRRESRAEVHFDAGSRGLYATDASLYQIEPLGVVVPRTAQDVVTTVAIAAEERVPIVPRGAATSLSGQTIGAGIVIDFSKYLNRIGIVDRDEMTVRVEAGVVLDQLNAHLKPLGLMFGPDVSTSDRATIGGMIGNNSAGSVVAVRQDGRSRACRRGRACRARKQPRWARFRIKSLRLFALATTRSPRLIAWYAIRWRGTFRRSGSDSPGSCAGSAATTSTSLCRGFRFVRWALTRNRGGSTCPSSSWGRKAHSP